MYQQNKQMGYGEWVLSFPRKKTQTIHFCQLRKLHNDPILKIDASTRPTLDECTFLGIIFFTKILSFIAHIKKVREKRNKALQVRRMVAHRDWCADKKTQLK